MKPETITADSSPDIVLDWLHQNGWSIQHEMDRGAWKVQCTKADRQINTRGATLEEAWFLAVAAAGTQEPIPS